MLSLFGRRPKVGATASERRLLEQPLLPEGTRIYAIGDVHGRVDLLRQVFARIDAERLAPDPPKRILEILVGDYVDRGPDSRGVLDAIVERQASREVICLSGNHEDLLLGFLRDPSTLRGWRNNGARETLLSYGIPLPARLDVSAMQEVAARFRDALPPAHHRLLSMLALSHEEGGYFFAHAGVRPGVPLAEQSPDDLLWIRREFLDHTGSFGRVVVHGHTPVEAPEFRENRINIDTGAVFSGRLTCLVLEGSGSRIL